MGHLIFPPCAIVLIPVEVPDQLFSSGVQLSIYISQWNKYQHRGEVAEAETMVLEERAGNLSTKL